MSSQEELWKRWYEEEKQKNHRIMSKAQELRKRLVNCFLLLFVGLGSMLAFPRVGVAVCYLLVLYGGFLVEELKDIDKDY